MSCIICSRPVKFRSGRFVLFCSVKCSNQSRRKLFPKPCGHCKINFLPPTNHSKQRFCSLHCRDAARTLKKVVICAYCESSVVKANHRATGRRFCSKACEVSWRKINAPRGSAHGQYKRVQKHCEVCGTKFERCPSQVRVHTFCSKLCQEHWQRTSGYISGSNSPAWKGGYQEYYGPNWLSQRRKARARDKYLCQRCGISESDYGKCLDVHHRVPFSKFGLKNYRAANRLANLACYCNRCHTTVEWESGRANSLTSEKVAQPNSLFGC